MIEFHTLSVNNFFRISNVDWSIFNQGIVLITGDNKDSSTSNSNGAGKSSLFEALLWCLWGKTVRGYSGDKVVNRKKAKDCYVILDFLVDGTKYTLERYRKHSKFKNTLILKQDSNDISGHTIVQTQETLNDLLGIDFDTFIRGPMMPQGSFKRFSEMTDSEVKAILDQAARIGVFSEALELANKDRKKYAHELEKTKILLDISFESLEAETKDKEEYLKKEMNFKDEINQNITDFNISVAGVKTKIANLKIPSKDDLLEQIRDNENKEASLRAKLEDLDENRDTDKDNYDNGISRIKGELYSLKSKLKYLARDKKDILALSKSKCPVCYQNITHKHVDSCVKKINVEIKAILDELDSQKSDLDEISTVRGNCMQSYSSSEQDLDDGLEAARLLILESKIDLRDIEAQEQTLSMLKEQEKQILASIEKEKRKVSPFASMIIDSSHKIKSAKKSIVLNKAKYCKQMIQLRAAQFWEEGFGNKGIKSLILESIVPFLNKQVNYYADLLTGGEIAIEFLTKKALKSGELRESFSVQVTNNNGAEDYEGNSGGEQSRADLAINFALSDLVSSRAKKSYPQRFFDEPFENIDERGIEAVMELFTKMNAGSMFVVTHQEGLKNYFNKELKIVKKNGETRIVR